MRVCSLSIIFLLNYILLTLGHVWTHLELSDSTGVSQNCSPVIELSVNSASLCVFDSLTVKWKLKDNGISAKNAMLAISITGQKMSFVTSLAKRLSVDVDSSVEGHAKGTSANRGIIKCITDVDEEFCIPAMHNIHSLTEQSKLALDFKQDTNQPPLPSSSALDAALHFTPSLFGAAYGEWVSPTRLEIKVEPEYLQVVLNAFAENQPINIEPNIESTIAYETYGSVSFRSQTHGKLSIVAVDKFTQQTISNTVASDVSLCDEAPLLPDSFEGIEISDPDAATPVAAFNATRPAVHMKGMFAVSGQDDLRFEHSSLPFLTSGNWSLSFWLRLLEGPTGIHRTLLYKGHPTEVGRTPSVWLLPHTNRLAVRLSTESDPDSGAESTVEIPLNQWTHITMVFSNLTAGTSTNHYYTAAVYINGQLDISLKFSTPVIGNDGAVHLFKDISHSGPRSFVSDLVIWEKTLDAKTVRQRYSQGLNALQAQPVDDTIQMLLDASSKLLPESLLQSNAVKTDGFIGSVNADASDEIARMLLDKAKASTLACDLFETRLDLYAEAAERGSAEALHLWAMMIRYGYESSASGASCGYEKATPANAEREGDQERALLAFLVAAEMGYAPALVPIALSVLTGLGLNVLLHPDGRWSVSQFAVPVSRDFIITVEPRASKNHRMRDDSAGGSVLESVKKSAGQGDGRVYRVTRLHQQLSEYLVEAAVLCEWRQASFESDRGIDQGFSVLCPQGPYIAPLSTSDVKVTLADPTQLALGLLYLAAVHNTAEAQLILSYRYQYGLAVIEDLETSCQYSLLAAAAASEDYHKGKARRLSVKRCEARMRAVGGQPIIEADRINDKTAREIPAGNTGDDDTLIQHQMVRASEGHVPSMMAMGDLYYYGARGLPRDQVAALRYFEQAANLGNDDGKCAAAGMYLKGEGTAQNTTKGVALYKDAAQRDSVRAFNGLGYVYYFGAVDIPQNHTEAFYYFMRAAETETEPDSLFNAGYCLENGIGVERNFTRSVSLYTVAAKKFGHFDAVKSLAWTYMEGRESIPRSPSTALQYLNAAKSIGAWSGWIRRGFDNYLSGNKMSRALACYLHTGELGYEVSQSNAAYVLKSKVLLNQPSSSAVAAAAAGDAKTLSLSPSALTRVHAKLQQISPSTTDGVNAEVCESDQCDSSVSISGDVVSVSISTVVLQHRLLARQYGLTIFHGNRDNSLELGACGVQRDYAKAIHYYTQASAQDNALASLYLGVMNHFGIGVEANIPRANRYYSKALSVGGLETQLQYMTKLLLQSLSLVNHRWLSSFHLGLEYVVKLLWGGV